MSPARSVARSAAVSASPSCSTAPRSTQQASALVAVGGQLYHLVVVPLSSPPQPAVWVAAGIRIDDAMAQEMRRLTGLDVTLLSRPEAGQWKAGASTLAEPARSDLARDIGANRYSATGTNGNAEFGEDAITRVIDLAPRADDGAVAVLQRSLPAALETLYRLEQWLALVALLGIGATVGGRAGPGARNRRPAGRNDRRRASRCGGRLCAASGRCAQGRGRGSADGVSRDAGKRRGEHVEDDRTRPSRRADGAADEACCSRIAWIRRSRPARVRARRLPC